MDNVYVVRKVTDGVFGTIVDICEHEQTANEIASACDRGYPGVTYQVQRYIVNNY